MSALLNLAAGQQDWVARLADVALYGFSLPQEPELTLAQPAVEGPLLHLRFTEGPEQEQGFAAASAPTRNFAANTGAVLARAELLAALSVSVAGAPGDSTDSTVLLPLAPQQEPERFLSHLAPRMRPHVARQISMVTEQRRLAMGLSARLPAQELRQRILLDGLGPAMAALLARHMGLAAGKLRLAAPSEIFEGADVRELALPRFAATDPLSVNLAALAIRRGYFGSRPKELQKFFTISPHGFGRRLARQPQLHPGDVAAALAVCQFSFLFLN